MRGLRAAPPPDPVPEPPDAVSAGLDVLARAPIAAGDESRTDVEVTFNLADKIRNDARLAGLRADDRLDDDASGSAGRAGALGLQLLAPRPVSLVRADAPRPSWTSVLDATNRLHATKCCTSLGWAAGDALIARIDRTGSVPLVVVTAGAVTAPTEHAVTLDRAGRFRLAPTIVGALGLQPGSQLLLTALPQQGQAAVFALDDVVPVITSVLLGLEPTPAAAPKPVPPQPLPPARRTNVRPTWTAPKAS